MFTVPNTHRTVIGSACDVFTVISDDIFTVISEDWLVHPMNPSRTAFQPLAACLAAFGRVSKVKSA